MKTPLPNPRIMQISPYIGGDSKLPGHQKVIKLSSNEGAFGPSPQSAFAYKNVSKTLHRYPDGNAHELRVAIGKTHRLDPNLIVCGAGSDELISLLCKAFSGPKDEVLYSQYGFLMYSISALAAGAIPISAPETKLTANVDALLKAVTKNTKLLFLANPNNPTGTYITKTELLRLRAGLRDDIILVIDAAYAEYVNKEDYTEGNELVKKNNNVIVTRTFSKSHGLGGLRLGWAFGPLPIIDVINRIRGPFNVSAGAQAAGIAAMLNDKFSKMVYNHNLKWLSWTQAQLMKLGLEVTDSVGNFLLVTFQKDGIKNAKAAEKSLRENRILVRSLTGYSLPNSLRISIGLENEMSLVVDTLAKFLKTTK